jgi:calcineurin-like phosphoesterase family protein
MTWKTLFTADLHFGHSNVIRFCQRPFLSAEEMDATMIANWQSTVNEKDTVYILGDVFFCSEKRANDIMKQLPGRKILIYGNHDKMIRKSVSLKRHFAEIYDYHEIRIDNQRAMLCHYPILSWNGSFSGSFMLHGHCHGKIEFSDKYRRLDVGVDVHGFKPVTWETICEKLQNVDVMKTEKGLVV